MRPVSIERFDLFYLLSLALSTGAFLLGYEDVANQLAAETAAAGFEMGGGLLIGIFAGGILINLLLWYLTSRKANVIAKWILIVFFGIGLIGVPDLFTQEFTLSLAINIGAYVLAAISVWFLFQPDTRPFFDGEPPAGADSFK